MFDFIKGERGKVIIALSVALFLIVVGSYLFKAVGNKVGVDVSTEPTVELLNLDGTKTETTTPTKKTTTPTTKTTTQKTVALPTVDTDGAYLVYYTATGFSPSSLQIKTGSTVRFVNKSDSSMRIYATDRSLSVYREIDQSKSVGKLGTYDFTFNQDGMWVYTNYNRQSHNGSILAY